MGGPALYSWIDNPGNRHSRGVPHTFADGHAEFYRYRDPLTSEVSIGTPAPNSVDFEHFLRMWSP